MSRKSKSDWSRILSEYGKRDCSREEFCEKHKINVASLKYHLNQKEAISAFTPVKIVEEKKKSSVIILELPQGIVLRVES